MEIKAKNIWFRARALRTNKLVEGYFVMMHIAVYAKDGVTVEGYKEVPQIYNDIDHRSNGSYWTEIDLSTLELIEQLTLFDD